MHTDPSMRERLFTMRMSEEEHERIQAVAEHYALNAAGLIRMLVKREFDTVVSREPAKKEGPLKKWAKSPKR